LAKDVYYIVPHVEARAKPPTYVFILLNIPLLNADPIVETKDDVPAIREAFSGCSKKQGKAENMTMRSIIAKLHSLAVIGQFGILGGIATRLGLMVRHHFLELADSAAQWCDNFTTNQR